MNKEVKLLGVFLVFMLFLILPFSVPEAKAQSTWKYFKDVVIYNDMDIPLDNYQVPIVLNSENFDFSKAKADGSDIRIVDTYGNFIPYWIEYWNATEEKAKIWIKVSIPANSKITVKLLYGNDEATYAGDGNKVFEFFDDFNENALDTNKWQPGIGSWSVEDGVLIQTEPLNVEVGVPYIYTKNFVIKNGIVEMKFSPLKTVCPYCYNVGTSIMARYNITLGKSYVFNAGGYGYAYEIAWWPVPQGNWMVLNSTGSQYFLENGITYHFRATFVGNHLIFDVLQGSLAGTHIEAYDSTLSAGAIGIMSWQNPRVDWIFVRKYAEKEPRVIIGEGGHYESFSQQYLTLAMFWYFRYQKMHEEYQQLYQNATQLNINNETLSASQEEFMLAESYFNKVDKTALFQGNILALSDLRKAYIHLRNAITILEEALRE
ncbi:MAG: DUF2341 domain-containing protein [Thermococcus sp.]|uniref:DUF2341 domain-containing protein n=1 Tax=Thermococcus sp. TaxID=35749 RepID=UPI001DDF6E55|nr:DUF2341 domain-containing protein [Thermococcus sp.]MBO8174361.1 DUF2341 domain-containing protein [Thermococcus sp.]